MAERSLAVDEPHAAPTTPRVNVLLVDDQPANLLALESILGDLGHNLVRAHSGEQALEKLGQEEYALVLLDVQMPGLDGFETAERIRSQDATHRTPIIFLTAFESDRFPVEKAYALGAVDYLVKPLVPIIVRAKVSGLVELFEKTRQVRQQAEYIRHMERRGFERKLAEENRRLRRSEARKAAIVETSLDAIITIDEQGLVVEFNPAAEQMFGFARGQAVGRAIADLVIPPPLRQAHRRALAALGATGTGRLLGKRVEMPALRADGSEFPVEIALTRMPGDGPAQYTAYLRDISDRTRSERHRNARLAITQILSQAATVHEAAGWVMRAICEHLGWDVGYFWIVDDAGTALRFLETWHRPDLAVPAFDAACRDRTFRREEGLPGRVWATGEPLWLHDVVQDTNFPRAAAACKAGLHGAFGCPVTLGAETLGVIEFFSRWIQSPDEDLLEMVSTVAGQIGQFLERKQVEEQQKRAVEALKESEQRFARFMQHLPGLAWIKDLDGRYVYANDAAVKAFGAERERIQGRTDDEIFPPDTAAHFKDNDRQALASAAGVQVVETLQQPDGVVHHSLVSKFPIAGADGRPVLVGGMAIDITDRRRAADELRQNKERLELAQHAGRIGTFDWNLLTDAVEWSAIEEELYGLPAGGFGGRLENWHQAVHPDDRERALEEARSAIARRGEYNTEFRIVRPDGQVRWIAAQGRVVCDDASKPLRMVGVNIDITERKESEALLREADRRKDEFLATLAHELRNPLAPIRNALQILKLPRVDAAIIERSREMMERQVHHLVRLVDDLLDVSRVMRGKIELRKERVDLATIVARAVETAQPIIDAQGHELTISLPENPLPMDADPVRLAQVLGNLLTNAAKYTESRGRIWLNAERDDGQVVVRVRDSGIGIAPEMLPHVFELFVQADSASTRAQGGLGIGLTLVRNLVDMHQGTVEATSPGLGRGCEFIVRLPLAPFEPAPGSGSGEFPAVAAPLRLLVVDDNRDGAESLATMLRLQGHEVRLAFDGATAIEIAREYRPQAVLLDLGMPGMDGFEVARRMRLQPGLEQVRFAALTGWGQQEGRRRSARAGFDHHLVKPVEPKALAAVLAQWKSVTG